MQIRGPPLGKPVRIGPVAYRGDVVKQGIKPDINGEFGIKGYADPPRFAASGDVDILELRFDKADDLVAAAFGLDEVGVFLVKFKQFVPKRAQGEKPARLLPPQGRGVVDRAILLFIELALGLERFAPVAVPPFVAPLVNVPVVFDLLDERLTTLVVALFAGLNEIGKAQVEGAPNFLELFGHIVAIGLGFLTQLFGPAGDFDRVFVISHEEKDFMALHAPVSRLGIRPDLFKSGANMGAAVGVINGRGQEKALGHHADPFGSYQFGSF